MAKGMVEITFTLAIIFIILMVVMGFTASFTQATPALQAQKDLKGVIETVCADGGPSASGLTIFLPKTDAVTGNPLFQKLHMTTEGSLEYYTCSNTGPSCKGDRKKVLVLDCPAGTTFKDCWVAPSTESVSVSVLKNTLKKEISLNRTTGVSCT
jgi:hypothetical protein